MDMGGYRKPLLTARKIVAFALEDLGHRWNMAWAHHHGSDIGAQICLHRIAKDTQGIGMECHMA